jgi:hypothetical protein
VTADVYIIRRNSPESRLLSHVGFDRSALQVAEWRGRRRSKGGYGKAPVAWRISGESDVRKLCEGIVRILGSKPLGQLTPEDKKALSRARRTLAAFDNRARRSASSERVKEDRTPVVLELLQRRLPGASDTDLAIVLSVVERATPRSVDELMSHANDALAGRPAVWQHARGEFVVSMSRKMGRR